MFKRENRLVRGAPEFILKVKENGLLINRFRIVVSKKIDKRAVVRNKIKRMFRSGMVELNKNMIVGHDILFIAKIGSLNKTKEEIGISIKNALEKAGLIK